MNGIPDIEVVAEPRDVVFDPRDDRKPVPDTLITPFSSICRIGAFRDGLNTETASGTGWIVNPLTVVTAGHVVFHSSYSSTDEASYAKKFVINPAYTEAGGVIEEYSTENAVAHAVFRSSGSVDFDIAVLRLASPLAMRFRSLAYYSVDDTHLINQNGFVAGFPVDHDDGKTMVVATGRVVEVETQRMMHQIDTVAGQSGAPLWVLDTEGNPVVVGVHVDGFGARAVNSAVRINEQIKQWIEQQTLGSS